MSDPTHSSDDPVSKAGSVSSGGEPPVKTLRISLPPEKPDDAASGESDAPIFFSLPSKGEVPASAESDGLSLEDTPPALPAVVPGASSELDDLPGVVSQGAKLALWGIILAVFGGIFLFVSFGGGINLKLGLGLGLIALVLAVGSFFTKPQVVRSIVAVVLAVLVAGWSGKSLFMPVAEPSVAAPAPVLPAVAGNPAEVVKPVSPVGSPKRVPPVVSPTIPEAPVEEEETVVEGGGEILPPEQRGSTVENEFPAFQEYRVLPPEQRSSKSTNTGYTQVGKIWIQVEKGLGPGALMSDRQFASRVSDLVGYPLPVFEGFTPELRLYVLCEHASRLGESLSAEVEVSPVPEVSSSLYDSSIGGGSGSAGADMGGGPGPLPANRVSSGSVVPLAAADRLLLSRGYGTSADGVGKFLLGVSGAQIRSLVDEALAIGMVDEELDGKKTYSARFDRQVGWDSSGVASTRLRVVMGSDGGFVDAYPY